MWIVDLLDSDRPWHNAVSFPDIRPTSAAVQRRLPHSSWANGAFVVAGPWLRPRHMETAVISIWFHNPPRMLCCAKLDQTIRGAIIRPGGEKDTMGSLNNGSRAYVLWQSLGAFIGEHLMLIVPAGVVIGVLFPQVLLPIKPLVPTFFAIMTLQNSLSNDLRAMRVALQRPAALLITVLVVHVCMPLLTFALSSLLFGPQSPTVAGVVLEYTVPIGASTVMWVGMFSGELALGLSTLMVSTLISPVTIPWTLQLLVGTTVQIDTLGMMGSMVYMVAIPALVATAFNELSGGWAKRVVAPATTPVSRLLLPLIVATNATGISEPLRHLTPRLTAIMLVMLAFAIGAFVIGMVLARWLSKGDDARFVAVSFSCGIRNVTAGAVLASQYFGPEVMFPAIIATPFQQVLAAIFGRIMKRTLASRSRE